MSSDRRTPSTAATAPIVPTGRAASRLLPASHPPASRLLAVLLLACAALLGAGTGAPARADATPATTATGASIAEALKTSPVYVDPAFAAAVTPAQQQQLTEQIAATGLPVKVVLVPLQKGDAFDGSAKAMAAVVQERLGQSPLIMVTSDDYGSWLNGFEWPADTHQVRDSANAVGLLKELKDAGLAAKVGRVIDLVATGKGTEVYKAEADRVDREYSARPHTDDTPGASPSSSSATGPFALAAALVLALVVGAALVARSRRRPRHTAFTFPDAVFAADRAADEAGLRRQAADEVLALGAALDEADGSAPGLGRALDAYDAAGRVLDGADGIPDLAGVLALAAEGRAALAPEPRLPLCFFDPRHGTAVRRTTWRPLGRRERVDVAVCTDCGQALRTRRSPQVLAVRDQGRTVPYFEVSADRSLWAATGYGSLLSGPEDTLAARVGTGQFTRAAHRRRSTEPHQD